jgi:hypothetical protein
VSEHVYWVTPAPPVPQRGYCSGSRLRAGRVPSVGQVISVRDGTTFTIDANGKRRIRMFIEVDPPSRQDLLPEATIETRLRPSESCTRDFHRSKQLQRGFKGLGALRPCQGQPEKWSHGHRITFQPSRLVDEIIVDEWPSRSSVHEWIKEPLVVLRISTFGIDS